MRISYLALLMPFTFITACGYPAMTSVTRSNFPADARLEMKCEYYADRNPRTINPLMSKYYAAGWRLAVLSEYTSSGRATYPSIVCFERISDQ